MQVFWDVLKDHTSFFFRVKQSKTMTIKANAIRSVKTLEPLTWWQNITSQKTWILRNAAVTTANLTQTHVFNKPLLVYGQLQTGTIYSVMAVLLSRTNWPLLDKFLWNFILGERVLQSAKKTEVWLKMDKSQQLVRSSTASCGSSFAVCYCCDYVFYSSLQFSGMNSQYQARCAHTAVCHDNALTFSNTYLHVSMWKQVLRKEQSPRLSSVCFWIIFLKCSFLHGSAEFTLVHSTLVPCGQNSITCAPVT